MSFMDGMIETSQIYDQKEEYSGKMQRFQRHVIIYIGVRNVIYSVNNQ